MEPHPESPSALVRLLGLSIDLSRYGSPAIVGPTGKRHYYAHGGSNGQREATHILKRLIRLRTYRAEVKHYANKDQAWWDEWNRNKGSAYTEELTPTGPQLVIPGCERQDRPRTAQLSLWP